MADAGRVVWWNGALVPEADARLSIYDSALMFGDMVFEMTRSFGKRQFKLGEHLDRLLRSARTVQIPLEMTTQQLQAAIERTIEANEPAFAADDEHRLMINVSRGLLSIYEEVVGIPAGPQVMVADFPLRWTVAGMGQLFDVGINAVIPPQRAIPSELLDMRVKHRSRLHFMRANIEVSAQPGTNNWALLLDPEGFIAEGTGDNFFIVKNGALLTPEGRNVLLGISRRHVMEELAPQLSLRAAEANLTPVDVLAADEAFMTATPFCLLPVTSLNGAPIGTGRVGQVTNRLLRQWSENVGVDIAAQIKAWDAARRPRRSTAPSPSAFQPT